MEKEEFEILRDVLKYSITFVDIVVKGEDRSKDISQ